MYGQLSITNSLENLYKVDNKSQYFQSSSYDRKGFNWDAEWFDPNMDPKTFEGKVLVDVIGKGQVSNIWFTWDGIPDSARLKFYIDGEENPRINMSIKDMTNGNAAPFCFPLSMNNLTSSGGWTMYIPVPFEKSLKIVGDSIYYFHIDYQMFGQDKEIKSYSANDDYTKAHEYLLSSPDMKTGKKQSSKTVTMGRKEKECVFEQEGAYIINEIEICVDELKKYTADEKEKTKKGALDILNNIWLNVYYDGSEQASVHSPLGMLFASTVLGAFEFKSLACGMNNNGEMYIKFPMPFKNSVKVELETMGTMKLYEIKADVYYSEFTESFDNVGYFSTKVYEQTTVWGEYMTLLKESGLGHIVAVNQNMDGDIRANRLFLEGDEFLYVDNKFSHTMAGTGTEDFYMGAWYFNQGTFQNPYYGYNVCVNTRTRNKCSLYRHFISEPITFRAGVDFIMEHSPYNNSAYDHYYKTHTAYYKVPNRCAEKTDEMWIDSNKDTSPVSHNLEMQGVAWNNMTVSRGDMFKNVKLVIEANGMQLDDGTMEFDMLINKNNDGAMLRRRTNPTFINQKADVYVDGVFAGTWYDSISMPYDDNITVMESDFVLDNSLVKGKNKVRIKLDTTKYKKPFMIYKFEMYSL